MLLVLALAIVVSAARFATLLPTYTGRVRTWSRTRPPGSRASASSQTQIEKVACVLRPGRARRPRRPGSSSGLLGIVSNLFFILALVLFMTIDGGTFPRQLGRGGRDRPRPGRRADGFAHGTRRYLVVSTVFGLIVAVLDTIALYAARHPGPVAVGAARVPHQLHPQHRLHHRPDPAGDPGPARGRPRA